ncbi:unnamed protein product [Orchesella dallaii]|uniref:Uncharacterized protein n=1 Tax=Orchesella dallaii TaxID=48710 RepID=A0ABP1QDB2_9HEXA
MSVSQLPFLLNRKKAFPAFAELLEKRCKKLEQSIAIVYDPKRFNDILKTLTIIFRTCENELKSRDETWLFPSERIKHIDIHLGLLLHHLYELGFETTILWRNHPRVDLYYRRFITVQNVKKVLNWSANGRQSRWKVCFTGLLLLSVVYGVTRWINTKSTNPISKSKP